MKPFLRLLPFLLFAVLPAYAQSRVHLLASLRAAAGEVYVFLDLYNGDPDPNELRIKTEKYLLALRLAEDAGVSDKYMEFYKVAGQSLKIAVGGLNDYKTYVEKLGKDHPYCKESHNDINTILGYVRRVLEKARR
jgi:hypothetical protein